MTSKSLIVAGSQLTRLASTAEFISDNPPHWAIESYIPVPNAELVEALLSRAECPTDSHVRLREVFAAMADLLHHRGRALHTGFAIRYTEIDPDRDSPIAVRTTDHAKCLADANRIAEMSRQVLSDAGYSEVDRAELERSVGASSEWGVPLEVDFGVFDLLLVYTRGDIVGSRTTRRWRQLFKLINVDVPIYQRVVVMFKLREGSKTDDQLESSMLHLRMFKNVPKLDIDMLLPGTQIRISWLDRTRTIVPSLGGIGVQIYKLIKLALFVAVITYSVAAMILGLAFAIIGYVVRTILNHFQTRNRYMLSLTRSLYYQKLDTNAGVAFRLLYEAESQRHREVVLAYYALLTFGKEISMRKLRRRVQRLIREVCGAEVDYRASDAIKTLESWSLIKRDATGALSICTPEEAMHRIDRCWDRKIDP